MASLADKLMPAEPDTTGRLAQALSQVRWVTLGVLLLLSLARPLPSRAQLPMWGIILLFGAYNLILDLLRSRVGWLRSFARVALLDLPVSALAYSMGWNVSGPLFPLMVLTLFSAVVSTKLRGSIVSTVAVMAVVAALAPTFPYWSPDEQGLRDLVARLIVLAVVGTSASIIMRQLWLRGRRGIAAGRSWHTWA